MIPRVVVAAGNLIAESPVWSVSEQALYWVDVEGRLVQRLDASGEIAQWPMPEATGCIGLRRGGGLVAAMRTGFHTLDTDSGAPTPILDPEADLPENRFNDGKVDRRGRFWAGSKHITDRSRATGALWRLDGAGGCTRMDEGFTCTNGIAWSADDRTMYLCDTWVRRIYAYDFDLDAGTVARRRLFAELSPEEGYPDGLTVDAENFVWSARFDGGGVARYAPDGRLDRFVALSVRNVTSVIFGGADLATLYITTARFHLTEAELGAQPDAGHIFAIEPGVKGLSEPEFG